MPNVFLNLPAPAANAAGAAVDVSAMGKSKSIVVFGSWGTTITPIITIEISNDATGTGPWTAIGQTQGNGQFTTDIACKWMRARVANYRGGVAPEVDVGGDDSGTLFDNLPVTPSNGAGAWVDVSGLPLFKTIQCGGTYNGSVIIEVSEDGTTATASIGSFQGTTPSQATMIFAAKWMRARRVGVPDIAPGLPVVNVGACPPAGAAASSLNVDQNGVLVVAHASTLNFTGSGVTVTDAGGGQANVAITGPATFGNPQGFFYTVTGAEPDKENLVIPLPANRPNNTYGVTVTPQTQTTQTSLNVPDVSKTVAQFVLVLGAAAVAGDKFWFYVANAFTTL